MKVVWTERSALALEAVGEYIAKDDPEAATRWLARLVARAEKAAVFPRGGRVVPELGRDDVREVFVRTYRIVYQIKDDAIFVLTVFEGSRLLEPSDVEGVEDE